MHNIKQTENTEEVILTQDKNAHLKWVMNRIESTTERYIEAEKMIIEIIDIPWWKRMFCRRKLIRFINNQLEKYNF